MKVKDISSYFNKPSSSQSQSQSSTNDSPPPIEVPSRRSTKKKKVEVELEPSVSDEEDPLPKDVRDKAKKKRDSDAGSSKKRKARVLSDSEDDDFVDKKDVKLLDKKKAEGKIGKKEEPPKKKAPNVDPNDFFSKEKVKREKVPEKKVDAEQPSSSKKEKRDSPKKESRKESPVKIDHYSPKRDKLKSKSPEKPVTPEKKSPIKSSKEHHTPPQRESPRKHSSSRSNKSQSLSSSSKSKPIDSDSEPEVNFNPKKKPTKSKSSSKSKLKVTVDPVTKKVPASPTKPSTPEAKPTPDPKRAANYGKFLARINAKPRKLGEKRIPVGTPDCLAGLTFVITGNLESLERDSCKDLIERHGGRVTTGVSGKTTHLIVGDDPGETKTKKAEALNIPMFNEDQIFEMIRASNPDGNNNEEVIEMMDIGDKEEEEEFSKPDLKRQSSKSPTKTKSINSEMVSPKKAQASVPKNENNNRTDEKSSIMTAVVTPASLMFVDKYRPKMMKYIVGQNKDNSNGKKLVRWLKNWFNYHGKSDAPKPKAAGGSFFKDPEGKTFKCALLSGLPGIGKTTTAHLACKEVGYDYFEMNASDTRNKKGLHEHVSDALSCKTMFGGINDLTSKHVLIMDEVDGMSGNEDRGGVQELIALIKSSRVPIICICNDRNHPKIRSLANYCFDLRFTKPTLQELKGFVSTIMFKENLKIDPLKINELCISSDFDIRQILHQLQVFKESDSDDVLKPKKDLRFGPWDICRKVFSIPEHEKMNIHERNGLFFQDYNIASLFVQENYAKWNPARAKQNRHARLELIARSAASIAEGDLTDTMMRRSNNWGLLPVAAIFSSYVPGELMESNLNGGIEFPKWLGKNSTKNKHHRQLQSLHTHVHLEVSGSLEALNMDYLPYLRRKICAGLISGEVESAVAVMEQHSLIRDDFEAINELALWPGMVNPFEKVDSKLKAAFTRMVNKEVLPYACAKVVSGRKKAGIGQDDYGDEEEEEEVVEDPEEEEKPEKDAMIKMKKKAAKKKSDKDDESAGPSKAKKSRKK